MKRPETVKALLNAAITLANTPVSDLKGMAKLNQEEQYVIIGLFRDIQNELGENREILEKFNLQYP